MARKIWGIQLPGKYNDSLKVYTLVISDDFNCSKDMLVTKLNALNLSFVIIKADYDRLKAIAIAINNDTEMLIDFDCIIDVFPGIAPDEENINNYMNWEHPPLAKYVLIASMIVLGNNELAWRIPSLIAGLVIWTLTVAITYRLSGRGLGFLFASLILGAGIIFDKTFTIMSSIAMLDIYVALFTIISLWFAINHRPLLSALFVGLSGSVKYSGFFAIPWLYIVARWSKQSQREAIIVSLIVPFIVLLITSLPIILYLGPSNWLNELIGAIKWHTTSRSEGPPYTTPWGLLIGDVAFPLYYVGWLLYLSVKGNAAISIVALLSGIAATIASIKRVKDVYLPSLLFTSIILGYMLVYLAGNRTLYSFYATHFASVALISASLFPLPRSDQLDSALLLLRKFFRGEKVEAKTLPELGTTINLIVDKPLALVAGIVGTMVLIVRSVGGDSIVPLIPCTGSISVFFCELDEKSWLFILSASCIMYFLFFVRETFIDEKYVHTLLFLSPILAFNGLSDFYSIFAPLLLLAHRITDSNPFVMAIIGLFSPTYAYAYIAVDRMGLVGFLLGHSIGFMLPYAIQKEFYNPEVELLSLLIGISGFILLKHFGQICKGYLAPLALITYPNPLLIEPYVACSVQRKGYIRSLIAVMLLFFIASYGLNGVSYIVYAGLLATLTLWGVASDIGMGAAKDSTVDRGKGEGYT